jgi:Concanavalin A-like lectin/glucanases superfamily
MKANPASRSAFVAAGVLILTTCLLFPLCLNARGANSFPEESDVGACIPPPDGPVSWWSGDRTAQDVQGTNPGFLLNGASFTKGMVGPGFVFDGVNGGVTVPNSASLSPTRITVAAWVYSTGNQNLFRHIISKDNILAGMREWGLSLDVATFVPFVGLNTGFFALNGATVAQGDTWYHVVMTHDGAMLRLYVNGLLDGSAAAVGDIVPTSNPVGIGFNPAGSLFFKGIIDEVQIFDRALTDTEILAMYQAGSAGQCKPEIFVSSIDPSYTALNHGFQISTSIVIQDVNGNAINDAAVQLGVILPSGSALTFPLKTGATGQADVSFAVPDSGLYQFKVRKVSHPTREYNASLNIETSDTLLIP